MADVSSRIRRRTAVAAGFGAAACRLALACAAIWLSAGASQASKLDEAACGGLKAERARIETEAIKSDMAKGPQWAKDNLSAERLKEIEQLISLQESIDFRCPAPRPAAVAKAGGAGSDKKAVSVEAPADADTPPASISTPPAASATVKPAKPAKKAASVSKKAPADQSADRPSQPKSTSKTSKTKPKVSDAYAPQKPSGTGEASAATSVTPLSP